MINCACAPCVYGLLFHTSIEAFILLLATNNSRLRTLSRRTQFSKNFISFSKPMRYLTAPQNNIYICGYDACFLFKHKYIFFLLSNIVRFYVFSQLTKRYQSTIFYFMSKFWGKRNEGFVCGNDAINTEAMKLPIKHSNFIKIALCIIWKLLVLFKYHLYQKYFRCIIY